jgi:hypothetical protein
MGPSEKLDDHHDMFSVIHPREPDDLSQAVAQRTAISSLRISGDACDTTTDTGQAFLRKREREK